MNLEDLEVYKMALELSKEIRSVYEYLPKNFKFNIGDQILRAIDSIGAKT